MDSGIYRCNLIGDFFSGLVWWMVCLLQTFLLSGLIWLVCGDERRLG